MDEHAVHYAVTGKPAKPGAEKLDIQNKDHRELIYRMATEREPVSDLLGVYTEKLFMFWCLYFLKDNIQYIPELELLILYKRADERVTIFDIVGKTVPPFVEVYPYISDPSDKTVEFRFMVDKMRLDNYQEIILPGDNGTHLLGNFPLEQDKIIFPYTAHA